MQLIKFTSPTKYIINLPTEFLASHTFRTSSFTCPILILRRFMAVIFVKFIMWSKIHLILDAKWQRYLSIHIRIQYRIHFFTITIQIIIKWIHRSSISRRPTAVSTFRIIQIIRPVRGYPYHLFPIAKPIFIFIVIPVRIVIIQILFITRRKA